MINKDKKSIILNWVVVLVILLTLVLTYYRSFISKDYEIIPMEDSEEFVVEEGAELQVTEEVNESNLSTDQILE